MDSEHGISPMRTILVKVPVFQTQTKCKKQTLYMLSSLHSARSLFYRFSKILWPDKTYYCFRASKLVDRTFFKQLRDIDGHILSLLLFEMLGQVVKKSDMTGTRWQDLYSFPLCLSFSRLTSFEKKEREIGREREKSNELCTLLSVRAASIDKT